MKLINPNKFFLLWHFLSIERKRNGKRVENFLKVDTPSIFNPKAKEAMFSILDESFVEIPFLSFDKDHLSFSEVLDAFKKSKKTNLKKLVEKNKFSYKDFFDIQDEFIKTKGNKIMKFNQVLSDLLILKNIKINNQKIESFFERYSAEVASSQIYRLEDYETVSIKSIADSGYLKKVLIEDIKERTKYFFGSDEKLNRQILAEELEDENQVDYLGSIQDQFILLPAMYYLHMIGDITITEIFPTHHYFKITFLIENERVSRVQTNRIYSLYFTEKEDKIFFVYINNNQEPVKLNAKYVYAKILYNVAKFGHYKIDPKLKTSIEEAVNNNINLKKKEPNPIYKKFPELESTKILKIEGLKVTKESGIKMGMK